MPSESTCCCRHVPHTQGSVHIVSVCVAYLYCMCVFCELSVRVCSVHVVQECDMYAG